MVSQRMLLQLKVQQVGQTCVFDLSGDAGQRLSARLDYPMALDGAYRAWVRCYLYFYKEFSSDSTGFRGQLKAMGNIGPGSGDWHADLVQAEAALVHQLLHWLRSAELYEMRSVMTAQPTDLLLMCEPLALARLPWEAWDLDNVRVARSPANIRSGSVVPLSRCKRMRVLAILGDESGLDFAADRSAIEALAPKAVVKFVGWQPGVDATMLKQQICDALACPDGWDILFFAGHSNETNLTGGKLAIAPGQFITIQELTPYLQQLKDRGLQLAIFNSCSGLSIAIALIDMGLSQVVVMREPVHNRVAQIFMGRFLHHLADYQDAHDALRSAIANLQAENLNYPSFHLVPSIFRHPEAKLLQLQPWGLRHRLKQILPSRREAIVLATLVLVSLLPPLQDQLLDLRIGAQVVYRMLTDQVTEPTPPPITLVQIDQDSLDKAGILEPNPMDRAYLAQLVDALVAQQVKMIAFDYLFDRKGHPPQVDQRLAQAIKTAVREHQTLFIFASQQQDDGSELGVAPETGIASPRWSLQGNIQGWVTHMNLPAIAATVANLAQWLF